MIHFLVSIHGLAVFYLNLFSNHIKQGFRFSHLVTNPTLKLINLVLDLAKVVVVCSKLAFQRVYYCCNRYLSILDFFNPVFNISKQFFCEEFEAPKTTEFFTELFGKIVFFLVFFAYLVDLDLEELYHVLGRIRGFRAFVIM